jgi:effector-binding domain-containing protein
MNVSGEIELQTVDALRIAAIRDACTVAELPDRIMHHVGTLLAFFKATGTRFGRCVVVYYDDGTGQETFAIDIGWEVDKPFAGDGDTIRAVMTPAGAVATMPHIGPYNRMGEAHEAIRAWCTANAQTITGTNWEVYDHPREGVPTRTDVYYQLA